MSQDQYGNYIADVESLSDTQTPGSGSGGGLSGSGSPEGVETAGPGRTYVDTDTGDLYVKQTGTGDTGWSLVQGGGSGTQEVFQGSGVPVAPPTDPTKPAIYNNEDNGAIHVWVVSSQTWTA